MNDSPAAILFDDLGNPIGVTQDGTKYRLQVDAKNTLSSSTNRSSVAGNTSDVLLISANSARLGLLIYNDSDSPVYIGLGSIPVTSSNFTFIIWAQESQMLPSIFIGEVRGIWQSINTGFARITEMI